MALHRLDLKSSGARIAAQDPDRHTAEIRIRVARINRFNAFGTPGSSAWPEPDRERGTHAQARLSATIPLAPARGGGRPRLWIGARGSLNLGAHRTLG
jgi:hypothetical protein